MTDVLIKRELLERIDETAICDGTDATISDDLFTQLVAALAAPRQPEGEAASILLPALRQYMHNDGSGLLAGYEYERTQRIVAELREECEHLKACQENAMLHMTGLVAVRDSLSQQLAERDAQIASMRAEVTPFIEKHWMPVAAQRDKLADLLQEVVSEYVHGTMAGMSAIVARIDAALAEVKP